MSTPHPQKKSPAALTGVAMVGCPCDATSRVLWLAIATHLHHALSAALLTWAITAPAHAANRTWIGGNNDWNSSNANWSDNDEPDFNDTAIFNSSVSVNLANANETVNGLTMSGGADLNLNGNDMIVDGVVSLSGSSTNLIVGPAGSVLSPDAVSINSGASLAMRGGTVTINDESGDGFLDINVGGTLSGHGIISLTDAVTAGTQLLFNDGTINATSTAIDIGGSTASTLAIGASDVDARLDLDGIAENGVVSVARNDTLDINVPLSDSFGGTINLSAGAMLDIASAWSMNSGVTNVNTVGAIPGTAGPEATISGGAFTQAGGSLVLDDIDSLRIASAYTATGTAVIVIDGGNLYLDGGGTFSAGVAVTMTNGGRLQGFGTINTDIIGIAEDDSVFADNGMLTLAGNFSHLIVGTADEDGILNVTNDWSTADMAGVTLAGGELRGATVTNNLSSGITGHGLISARIINDSSIVAEGGGTLIVATPGNDNWWDGSLRTGRLSALTADLELRDQPGVGIAYLGEIIVASGHEVFLNGFSFRFLGASNVELDGSARYRSTRPVFFESSTLSVTGGGMATVATDSFINFDSDSNAVLNGNLLVDGTSTTIHPGAKFSGTGTLINPNGSILRLFDGLTSADLDVSVRNEGELNIIAIGLVGGKDYVQTATGEWELNLGGITPGTFDRLSLTGAALLDGTLEIALVEGYTPTLGETLGILSAALGVTGTFETVIQPATMPAGLKFDVVYNPTFVQLQVVSAGLPGDFDQDGDVDGRDFLLWQRGESHDPLSSGDLQDWQFSYGVGALTAASTAVPEPGTWVMIALTVHGTWCLTNRKQNLLARSTNQAAAEFVSR